MTTASRNTNNIRQMNLVKPRINVCVIGNSYSGKSTLIGHLIEMFGQISKRQRSSAEEKIERFSELSNIYAYYVDQGTYYDYWMCSANSSLWLIETPYYSVTMINTPGLHKYTKEFASGVSQGDAFIIVVNSSYFPENESWTAEKDRVKELSVIAIALGIRKIIVAINKMDKSSDPSKDFKSIKMELIPVFTYVGFYLNEVCFIPISALAGDGLSNAYPWSQGPSIIEAIDSLTIPRHKADRHLRFALRKAYRICETGTTIAAGRVASGRIRVGDELIFAHLRSPAASLEIHHTHLNEAEAGDSIGIRLLNTRIRDLRAVRGCIAGPANDPPQICSSFIARVIICNHPGHLKIGYWPLIHCLTQRAPCKFTRFVQLTKRPSMEKVTSGIEFVKQGDMCDIELTPTKPLVCETYKECPELGRIIIRDMQQVVGVGVVLSVNYD